MTIREKLFGREIRWIHFMELDDGKRGIMTMEKARVRVIIMNRELRRIRRRDPHSTPMKATIKPMSCGMAQIIVWYGI